MTPVLYILDADHGVVCVGDDWKQWGDFFVSGSRHVEFDRFGAVDVSTVFMGIDHGIPVIPDRPILFETLVFRRGKAAECWRCATWKEAEEQHKHACELVKGQT